MTAKKKSASPVRAGFKPASTIAPEVAPPLVKMAAVWPPRGTKPKSAAAKPEKKPKAEREPKQPRKVGCIAAAAIVLADTATPMRPVEMIAEMGKRGLWSSPGGKTPEATLAAAIVREIATKGDASRFVKHGPGLFTAKPAPASAAA